MDNFYKNLTLATKLKDRGWELGVGGWGLGSQRGKGVPSLEERRSEGNLRSHSELISEVGIAGNLRQLWRDRAKIG
jgi:hypothetical protein